MAFTVLASFSLLALVVTARPIIPASSQSRGYNSNLDLQSAVQAVFQSRTKNSIDILGIPDSNYDIRFISAEEQQAYLSQLDSSAIKALVPLDENRPLSEDEKKLIEMLGTSDRMEDVEGASMVPEDPAFSPSISSVDSGIGSTTEEAGVASSHVLPPTLPSPQSEPVIIAISCVFALLSLLCIGAFLYAVYYVRAYVLGSRTAWDLLPQLEKQQQLARRFDDGTPSPYDEKQWSGLGFRSQRAIFPGGFGDEKTGLESDTDDDYEDAVSGETTPTATPRATMTALPSEGIINPLLIPLPSSPYCRPIELEDNVSDFGTPNSTPQQRTVALPDDVSSPGRASALDFAFALQLRPGFGVGADPAWLVRFLMAMFGWVAVLVSGPARQQPAPVPRRITPPRAQ
ncbi:hypothetical protein K488DRAFT_81510 [Vararia minispora EC-137]|uniref:Uncharacterized protein n=1 Tax=Vararia minispora EC-137 TaxID=1314806 RepID=A0ACB8QZ58_9AGAM|nr:hypothetical protein K488DRAFT_81510 [Vararia minispora EC-137]